MTQSMTDDNDDIECLADIVCIKLSYTTDNDNDNNKNDNKTLIRKQTTIRKYTQQYGCIEVT